MSLKNSAAEQINPAAMKMVTVLDFAADINSSVNETKIRLVKDLSL